MSSHKNTAQLEAQISIKIINLDTLSFRNRENISTYALFAFNPRDMLNMFETSIELQVALQLTTLFSASSL